MKVDFDSGEKTDPPVIAHVDRSWTDNNYLAIAGWILSKETNLDGLTISVDDVIVPITIWHPRPDINLAYPQYPINEKCGFFVHIPRKAKHQVSFEIKSATNNISFPFTFHSSNDWLPEDYKPNVNNFNEFISLINDNKFNVLEIGSRVVSPGSSTKRTLFPQASSYTGFDYYPDSNTDIVGDAHRLSQYFDKQKKFDAVFSIAVLEHLAMPWVIAKEINKVLPIGGYTYHHTVFAWPRHEAPWDFWRFSDDGLRILFSKAAGFEVIAAGLDMPLRMHSDQVPPGQETLAMYAGFGCSWILAKKIAEIDEGKINWDYSLEEILASDNRYPFSGIDNR